MRRSVIPAPRLFTFEFLTISSILIILFAWLIRDKNATGSHTTGYVQFSAYPILARVPRPIPSFSSSSSAKPKRIVSSSKGEQECRRVLEELFKRPFPKTRPKFLFDERTGFALEIDCYNEEMRLGVEYNGKQHYSYEPMFHKTSQAFEKQKERDELKIKLCQDEGVNLIIVPYTIKEKNIREYILASLDAIGRNPSMHTK